MSFLILYLQANSDAASSNCAAGAGGSDHCVKADRALCCSPPAGSFIKKSDGATTACDIASPLLTGSLASCTACVAAGAAGCTAGTCAAGFHTFASFSGGTAATCTACTTQTGCGTPTANTCSTESSILAKLKCTTPTAGYYVAASQKVTACTKPSNAATVTCATPAGDTVVVVTCDGGYTANSANTACVQNAANCGSSEGVALCNPATVTVSLHIVQTTKFRRSNLFYSSNTLLLSFSS